jgi:hypothetical protein
VFPHELPHGTAKKRGGEGRGRRKERKRKREKLVTGRFHVLPVRATSHYVHDRDAKGKGGREREGEGEREGEEGRRGEERKLEALYKMELSKIPTGSGDKSGD